MRAAEELDLIIASSDSFRNSKTDEAEDKMLEIFEELLPVMEKTVLHDPSQLYMGGSSGGAARAFVYSHKVNRPWAGIFSNGGWLGGYEHYNSPYPKMRVVVLNGNRDRAANRWIKTDGEVLEERGCIVNVFAFEGAHQVAPLASQVEALEWLLHGDNEASTAQPSSPPDSE